MDYPVFIPTPAGPIGGIVSEADGDPLAALVLLQGAGRPARSGVNSFWTRLARSLADLGFVVLRFDYACEGETLPIGEGGPGGTGWKAELDLGLLREATPWFAERTQGLDLFFAGSCSGARLAIELTAENPDRVAGNFLVVPYLKFPVGRDAHRNERRRRRPSALAAATIDALRSSSSRRGTVDPDAIDPVAVDCLRTIVPRGRTRILTGENDDTDIEELRRLLGPAGRDLVVDVIPGMTLHMMDQPSIQEEVRSWLLSELSGVVGSRPIVSR